MKKLVKKYFIPNPDNSFRPEFLSKKIVIRFLILIFVLEFVLFVVPTLYISTIVKEFNLASIMSSNLSFLTNNKRREYGLNDLKSNSTLDEIATMKANDMASKEYFAHISPEGKNPWHWFKIAGYSFAHAGENLAVSFTDSDSITRAWMESPKHKANIVSKNYTEIGTGVAVGKYKGRKSTFVAQVYAKPLNGVSLVSTASQSGLVEKILFSPQNGMNAVLYASLALVISTMLLNYFVKKEKSQPDLIKNGIIVALLIIAIFISNDFITHSMFETSFMHFEQNPENYTEN